MPRLTREIPSTGGEVVHDGTRESGRSPRVAWAAGAVVIALACESAPADPVVERDQCGPFGDWEESPFVLPYPEGEAWEVNQANCSGFGHSGFWKHGYDFIMPIGTQVTASRAGTVGWARDGCTDYDTTCTNLVTVIHDDGLVSLYSHLTLGGVLVAGGERVEAGDAIGLSGVTGNTGGLPHLHFSVHPCNELPGLPGAGDCPSVAANFRNTDPNPEGLEARRTYVAGPG
jgi:murein DD-endopeptidase MepM/ murein hydrolase activator NlpD